LNTAVESIRAELASVVGESRVVSDAAACAGAAVDGVTPASVIYPASAEQVAEALKYASDRDLAVIPFRNGTKLGVGNLPRRYDLALSLKDLNQVWHYEPGDLTVSVEPGMKLGDFQRFVARDRLWLPLDPAGGSRATIGGVLAAGETFDQGAVREGREELGVDITPEPLFPFRYEDAASVVQGMVYRVEHDGPFQLQAEEIERGEFLPLSEVMERTRTAKFCPDGLGVLGEYKRRID